MPIIHMHRERPVEPMVSACLTGACNSGEVPCPTRDACRLTEAMVFDRISTWLVAVGLAIAIASFCALAARQDLPGQQEDAVAAAAAAALCSSTATTVAEAGQ
jgi:hypothetical protein